MTDLEIAAYKAAYAAYKEAEAYAEYFDTAPKGGPVRQRTADAAYEAVYQQRKLFSAIQSKALAGPRAVYEAAAKAADAAKAAAFAAYMGCEKEVFAHRTVTARLPDGSPIGEVPDTDTDTDTDTHTLDHKEST